VDQLAACEQPAGVAVHGGSGISYGVIELLRAARPASRYLELAHRLDRETGAVDAVALVVGGAPVERNLFYAFEGVQRRLEARSNDTGVVTAAMQGARGVALPPVGAGNTSVVRTARNAGGSASHTVSVSVTTAVPQKIGTLNPDTIAFSGNNYFVVRIANVFSPATVKVAARSNDTGVVTAEVTTDGPDREPIVRVTPVGLGTTTVVITGSTSEGSVSYTWEVTVVAPN